MAKRKKHRQPSTPPMPQEGREPAAPTPERMARGDMREVRLEKGGDRVWVDAAASPLEAAYARGVLTEPQANAGRKLEALARRALRSGSRSCIDFSPRGESGDGLMQAQAAKQLRDAVIYAEGAVADWEAAKRPAVTKGLIGAEVRGVLLGVCWRHEAIGDCRMDRRRFRFLSWGLTALADFWGMQDRRREAAE